MMPDAISAVRALHILYENTRSVLEVRLCVFACVMQLDVDDNLLRCVCVTYIEFMRNYQIVRDMFNRPEDYDEDTHRDILVFALRAHKDL